MDIKTAVPLPKDKRKLPDLRPGDTVKVSYRVREGDRERVQSLIGVVLKVQGGGVGRSFTLRRISNGIGVERTFPVHSPFLERVDVQRRGDVRRARLFYLRGRTGRHARIKERGLVPGEELLTTGTEAEAAAAGLGAETQAASVAETPSQAAPPPVAAAKAAPSAEATAPAKAEAPKAEAPKAESSKPAEQAKAS